MSPPVQERQQTPQISRRFATRALKVLSALVLLFFPAWYAWNIRFLDDEVHRLARWRNIDIDSKGIRYSLIRGLLILEPTIRLPLSKGRLIIAAPLVTVKLNPYQWIVKKVLWCEGIEVKDAAITLALHSSTVNPPRRQIEEVDYLLFESRRPRFKPRDINIEGSSLRLHENGRQVLSLENLSLNLHDPILNPFVDNAFTALVSSGRLQSNKYVHGPTTYSELKGAFAISGGELRFKELSFFSAAGRYSLKNAKLDLSSTDPLLEGQLFADLKDVTPITKDIGLNPITNLAGVLHLSIAGSLGNLAGEGYILFKPTTSNVRSILPFSQPDRILPPGESVRAYGEWKIPFTLAGPWIEVKESLLQGVPFSLRIKGGRVRRRHGVELKVDVLLPQTEAAKSFSPAVVHKLREGDAIAIPISVTGPLSSATIVPQRDELSRSAYREVTDYFRSLGRD